MIHKSIVRGCRLLTLRSPGRSSSTRTIPDSSFPPIEPLLPPKGAPNVLVVLLDDVGFGAASAFGGPCATPVAERLAAGDLSTPAFIRPRFVLRLGSAVERAKPSRCWYGRDH